MTVITVGVGPQGESAGNTYTSIDEGATWASHTTAQGGGATAQGIIFDGSVFISQGGGSTYWTSPDGLTWTTRSNVNAANNPAVSNGSASSPVALLVAASLYRSTDHAATFGSASLPSGILSANNPIGIWDGDRFVIVTAPVGSAPLTITSVNSTDGVTWSGSTSFNTGSSAFLGTYPITLVRVGSTAAGQRSTICLFIGGFSDFYYTQDHGATWTHGNLPVTLPQPAAFAPWQSAWSGTRTVFGFSDNATGAVNYVLTTQDGITWTQQTMPTTQHWRAVTWTGAKFIVGANAGGIAGVENLVSTSPDGVTWTNVSTTAGNSYAMAGGFYQPSIPASTVTPTINHDFRNWQQTPVPDGLAPTVLTGPAGQALAGGLGDVKDRFAAMMVEAVKSRLPLTAPWDALAQIGTDRILPRGIAETDATYAARLVAAWASLPWVGTPKGILDRLAEMSPALRQYTLVWGLTAVQADTANTQTRAVVGTDPGDWSHFSLVFPVAANAPAADGLELNAIRALLKAWKPAFTICDSIVRIDSGNTWSLPVRTWNVGGTWADGTVTTWSP